MNMTDWVMLDNPAVNANPFNPIEIVYNLPERATIILKENPSSVDKNI
jgi:hypothetical protein